MSKLGWYCDEVTYNDGVYANIVFAEWKININNIDSTIYFLNKQPVPDGVTLSFSDWTPITLTNSNYESILLNPGIYWYKVVSAEGIASKVSTILPAPRPVIYEATTAIWLESRDYTPQEIKYVHVNDSSNNMIFFINELNSYRKFNRFGSPAQNEDDWSDILGGNSVVKGNMFGILQRAKFYIGFKENWIDDSGDYIFDYSKEYSLDYDYEETSGEFTLIDQHGLTFLDNIATIYQSEPNFNINTPNFRGYIKLSFVEFYTREVIKIKFNGDLYYLFNHADSNNKTLKEISSIRDIFVNRQISDISNNVAEGIFNAIISNYFNPTGGSKFDDENWIGFDDAYLIGNFRNLLDLFVTDKGYPPHHPPHMYILNGGQVFFHSNNSIIDTDGNGKSVLGNGGLGYNTKPFFGFVDDVNEIRNPSKNNRFYYYIAKGELLDENYIKVVDEISYEWKPALFNKPILSVLINNREYGIFSHINSNADANIPEVIIETILNENPSYTYTYPQNNNFLTNVKDLSGGEKIKSEWEAILKEKVEEVFDGSRNLHTLIVPFTAGGIYGMITESASSESTLTQDWKNEAFNIMNSNSQYYYYYLLEKKNM
jgi:hypothetical protein